MMELPDSVGGRIRTARLARGWTQDQLAGAVHVSRSAVAQWETDRAGQLRENLGRIAEALDVSVEGLLNGAAWRGDGDLTGNEMALVRLFRTCTAEDQGMLLRLAHKLAKSAG